MKFSAALAALFCVATLLSSPAKAQLNERSLTPLAHASNSKPNESDLLVIINTKKLPVTSTKNIAGDELLLVRSKSDYPRRAEMCIIADESSYPNLTVEEVHEVLSQTLRAWLNPLISIDKNGFQLDQCIDDDGAWKGGISQHPDIILIERRFSEILKSSPDYESNEKSYLQAGLISNAHFFEAKSQLLAARKELADKIQEKISQLSEAAKSSSDDQLGALIVEDPESKVNLCAVSNKRDDTPHLLGFSLNYTKYLPQQWVAEIKEKRPKIKFEETQFYTKIFNTLDDFYLDLKSESSVCHVFVGTPTQIQNVRKAYERDTGHSLNLIGSLVSKTELTDNWAMARGFKNFTQHLLASKIEAKAETIKGLEALGITSEASFLEAKAQMQAAKYGSNESAQAVLAFLKDQKYGASQGKSATTVKLEREKQERAQAEQQQIAQKREQQEYAKKFPFTAIISCSISENSSVNLNACFINKYNQTELEIKNGDDYKMYTPMNLFSAGKMTGQGLEIPLKRSFNIVAQNAGEHLLLSITILNNSSGQTVYKKSASQYSVIKISN